MSFFASSSIKTKLLSCFVIILILSCLVSGLSIKAMYSSINIATDLQDKISVGFRRVTAVSNALENSNEYMVSCCC